MGWANAYAITGVVVALAALALNFIRRSGGRRSFGGGSGVGVEDYRSCDGVDGVLAGDGFEDSDGESSTSGFNKVINAVNRPNADEVSVSQV